MLVSHRYKFIYTKTLKTAGTSVESYLERFCTPNGESTVRDEREEYVSESGIIGFRGPRLPRKCKWWNHMPAALIKEKLGETLWATYVKFCVIRNPYEKVVSAFYFAENTRNRLKKEGPAAFSDLDHERAQFEAWLRPANLPIDRDKYLIDGQFCLDDVIRHRPWRRILKEYARLGVPWDSASLPSLKAGFRPKDITVEALYTEKARKIVETAYSFEIGYFGYAFPAEG